MKVRVLAASAIAVLLLGACATVPPSRNEGKVSDLIGMINDGPVADVVEQSHVPFFFDAELLVRTTDVDLLWTGLRDAGFRIESEGFALEPAGAADYVRISDSFDMQAFFGPDGYLPADAAWLLADSSAGKVLILVGDVYARLPVIYGIARVR